MFTTEVESINEVHVGYDETHDPIWVEVDVIPWQPDCLFCGGPCERPMSHIDADFGFASDEEVH